MSVKQAWHVPGSVPVKVWTDDIEASAAAQLSRLATLPFIHHHIAVMPDVHHGIGSTVGAVIPTIKAVVPAAVGVDIGCGMIAHRLDLLASDLPDSLTELRAAIEAAVPHGRTDNGGANDSGAWRDVPEDVSTAWRCLVELDPAFTAITEAHPKLFTRSSRQGPHQLGTLGTGNHFIEVCVDTQDVVWLMLHSGSRGIGNRIGSYFIDLAKREMEAWHIRLADPDLAYLPEDSKIFPSYWSALSWAQEYARVNRALMMAAVHRAVESTLGRAAIATAAAVNCHHNYVAVERHFGSHVYVTRKGAVSARTGELGIIPGSMGAKSYIVVGKGNPESFCSCSHGAGRRMGRREAARRFTAEDVVAQTRGVECRKDIGVVDEIPGAYKPIDDVMANQSDLVDVVAELKQVVCVKG